MSMRLTTGRAGVGQLGVAGGVATADTGAATLHRAAGVVTTESLTTAAGAAYTLTLTNNHIAASDVVLASVTTSGDGTPLITKVTPAAGSVVIVVKNDHGEDAFDAALKIAFLVVKQG